MKCFNSLLTILVLFFFVPLHTLADEYVVMPSQKIEESLKLGDILYVEVINKTGNKVFTGKRMGSLLYVLDKDEKNVYRVIVSPENTQKKLDREEQDKFELSGFKFEKSLENYSQNFETEFKEYDIEEASYTKYIVYLIIIFLLPFGIKYTLMLLKALEKKKKRQARKKWLRNMILKAKTREELEKVYQYKKEIKEYLKLEAENIEDFIQQMNDIQYKRRWNEDDVSKISKVVGRFKKDVSGI